MIRMILRFILFIIFSFKLPWLKEFSFFTLSNAKEMKEIKILMREPDIPSKLDIEKWKINYESLINNYFIEKYLGDYDDVTIIIDYYSLPQVVSNSNSEYLKTTQFILYAIENILYDILIFDESFIFNDVSLIQSYNLSLYHEYQQFSSKFLLDLSEYFDKKLLEFHDPKLLSYGYLGKKLYALPYEIDYDLLYYRKENKNIQSIIKQMEMIDWNKLMTLMKEQKPDALPFQMSLATSEDLLNFFLEYTSNYHYLDKSYNKKYYKIFYNKNNNNEDSSDVLTSFRNFITKSCSGKEELNDVLFTSQDDIFIHFQNNETIFFKGKASYHSILENYSYTLPPKNITSLYTKYIAINRYSKVNVETLIEVLEELTSKQFQNIKSEYFGNIPTFDISKRRFDMIIRGYCEKQRTICDHIKNMKPIYIRDIFKNGVTPPFFEILLFIPDSIRTYLVKGDPTLPITYLKNTFEVISSDMGIYGILSITFIYMISFGFIILMGFVKKYKHRPYLNVILPRYCILIIIGCVYNMIKNLLLLPPYTDLSIKFYYVVDSLIFNVINFSFFIIIYHIYHIYKSKSFLTENFGHKDLCKIFTAMNIIIFIYKYIIVRTNEFYFLSYQNISNHRIVSWNFNDKNIYDCVDKIYYNIIVS
ncbi:hypothetical protein U3516DRAFT_195947 [Neocallimastix sp. 'constans']